MTDIHDAVQAAQILPISGDEQDRPFWSVMIPTYNPRFAYLKESLESVLVQDPGPERMQIEVVDDCSTEANVAEMVQRIAGERIKVSSTPQNLGLAGCWNLCIEKSKGYWVHILHQDDAVLPGFYEKIENAITTHENMALFASRSFIIDNQGIITMLTERVSNLEDGGYSVAGLYYSSPLQCPAVVVKRKAYEALGGFRQDYKFTVDYEMWVRIISQMGGIVLTDILARYRMDSGNESSRLWRSTEALADLERLHCFYAERYSDFNLRKARRKMWRIATIHAKRMDKLNDIEGSSAIRRYLRKNLPVQIRLQGATEQMLRRLAKSLGLIFNL